MMMAQALHSTGNPSVVDTVDGAVRPVLAAEGYDLVLVEMLPRPRILRLYIDRNAGDPVPAVSLDDCTRVSRLVSDLLDARGISDTIEGAFSLEVSSPGLDRPLVRPEHFVRFVGRQIKLTTRSPVAGGDGKRRRFNGELLAAEESLDGNIRLQQDGEPFTIAYTQIEKARLVPEL